MKWIIEYNGGAQHIEGMAPFRIDNLNLVNKIFYQDKKNHYGFYTNGYFFINNRKFNFKLDISNFEMEPFQSKTGVIAFNTYSCEQDIYSWNIGYTLKNNEESYEYKMSIYQNGMIYLYAKHFDNQNKVIDKKDLRLL